MEQVLDVYKRPYDEKNPQINMDESPCQLIKETKTPIAMKAGKEKKIDYEYERTGTCNVFMVNEPLTGFRHVKLTQRRTKKDWAELIKEIADELYPKAQKITLVMDNLNTHNASSLYETFKPAEAKRIWDRFEFIYTPKHGSWLNMAEIELNILQKQCLNRRIESFEKMQTQISKWQKSKNLQKRKINWRFTTKDARIKLKKLYPTFHN